MPTGASVATITLRVQEKTAILLFNCELVAGCLVVFESWFGSVRVFRFVVVSEVKGVLVV